MIRSRRARLVPFDAPPFGFTICFRTELMRILLGMDTASLDEIQSRCLTAEEPATNSSIVPIAAPVVCTIEGVPLEATDPSQTISR